MLEAPKTDNDIGGPLAGVRVLDLTQQVAGPFCTMMLANLGAEVVKVEPPDHGDGMRNAGRYAGRESHEDYFNATNNSKKSIVLDLKDEIHRQVGRELAKRADVLVENFAPGTAARLGMSWADLQPVKPNLLYCSISGFGQSGPESDRLAMDPVIQAVSGVMSVTGHPDSGPLQTGAPLADVITGMFAAYAIVGELHRTTLNRPGRYIDVSMQASLLAALGPRMGGALNAGIPPERIGNQNPMRAPCNVYQTRDRVHVFLMVHHDRVWAPFCRAMSRGEWIRNPRFATNALRCENRCELNALVASRFAESDAKDLTARLRAERVPYSVVNDYVQAVSDPQVVYRGVVQDVVHRTSGQIRVIGPPWLVNGQRVSVSAPPALDEHRDEVLQSWLGWALPNIERFRRYKPHRKDANEI